MPIGNLIHSSDVEFLAHDLKQKTVLLSIDVETDYGSGRTEALSKLGRLLDLVGRLEIPLTAFVEGQFFETRRDICSILLSSGADVQLHCYDHGTEGDSPELLARSVAAYADYCGALPRGYRAHSNRLNLKLYRALLDNGFKWDSSILPAITRGGNFDLRFSFLFNSIIKFI